MHSSIAGCITTLAPIQFFAILFSSTSLPIRPSFVASRLPAAIDNSGESFRLEAVLNFSLIVSPPSRWGLR